MNAINEIQSRLQVHDKIIASVVELFFNFTLHVRSIEVRVEGYRRFISKNI